MVDFSTQVEEEDIDLDIRKDVCSLKEMQAIVHTKLKLVYLKFEGEIHKVDLTEGDIEDNWNGITLTDGRVFDFNMDWQFCERNPNISLYGTYQGEEYLITNTSDSYSFKVLRKYKRKKEYFPKEYYTGFTYENHF